MRFGAVGARRKVSRITAGRIGVTRRSRSGTTLLTDEVRKLVDVLDGHRSLADLLVDLLTELTHGIGVLEEVVDNEREHAW